MDRQALSTGPPTFSDSTSATRLSRISLQSLHGVPQGYHDRNVMHVRNACAPGAAAGRLRGCEPTLAPGTRHFLPLLVPLEQVVSVETRPYLDSLAGTRRRSALIDSQRALDHPATAEGLLSREYSANTPPPGEPNCTFSYAAFRSGRVSPQHVTPPVLYVGCGGQSRYPSYAPDRRQVRPMDPGTVTGCWRSCPGSGGGHGCAYGLPHSGGQSS